jgi:hypothetical protein
MGIDWSNVRRIKEQQATESQEAAKRAEQRAKDEIAQSRIEGERRASKLIAELQQVVETMATERCVWKRIYWVQEKLLVSKPSYGIFNRNSYSPSCLPHYARRLYDVCKQNGLNPELKPGSKPNYGVELFIYLPK